MQHAAKSKITARSYCDKKQHYLTWHGEWLCFTVRLYWSLPMSFFSFFFIGRYQCFFLFFSLLVVTNVFFFFLYWSLPMSFSFSFFSFTLQYQYNKMIVILSCCCCCCFVLFFLSFFFLSVVVRELWVGVGMRGGGGGGLCIFFFFFHA